MPEPPSYDNNCQTEGILSTVAGIMGTLQANEVLKTILGNKNESSNSILIFDGLETNFKRLKLIINPNCINKC